MEEYLAINHMQRKLNAANPIHGAILHVAQVANENAKLLLANPSAAQTISGQNLTVAADLAVNGGDLTTSATTFNLLNATATTVNFAGAATTLAIGAATGTATIKNASVVLDGDLQVKGGDVTTTATTFNLLNTTATTVNFAGAATALNVGAAAGTVTVAGDLAVNGGDLTTSATTFNLLASPTTVNIGAAATTLNLGAATGTATIKNASVILDGDLAVNGGDLTTSAVTFNLLASPTTINLGAAATALTLGAATGTATIKNASVVLDGDLQVKGGDITTTATTFGLVDTTATTVNFAGAAATLNIAESVTAAQTVNVATGATASASTKAINIGTGGLAGSTTTVTVGAAAGTSTVALNGNVTVSNNLTVDGSTLHVDAANGRVGVGTTSPSTVLDIVHTVAGNAVVNLSNSSADPAATARYIMNNSTTSGGLQIRSSGHASEASDVVLYSSANNIRFYTNGNSRMSVGSTGNVAIDTDTLFVDAANNRVGVGTSAPAAPLQVVGAAQFDSTINKVTITAPATSATLTLANGSTLATSGAFSTTLTATAATNVTLPTTGTLATLAGTETLTNKTLTSPTLNSPSVGTQLTLGAHTVEKTLTASLTSTAFATLDTFDGTSSTTATMDGAEYLIVAHSNTGTNSRTITKVLLTWDAADAYIVEYGRISTGSMTFTVQASKSSNTITLQVKCDEAGAGNTVEVTAKRTAIKANIS